MPAVDESCLLHHIEAFPIILAEGENMPAHFTAEDLLQTCRVPGYFGSQLFTVKRGLVHVVRAVPCYLDKVARIKILCLIERQDAMVIAYPDPPHGPVCERLRGLAGNTFLALPEEPAAQVDGAADTVFLHQRDEADVLLRPVVEGYRKEFPSHDSLLMLRCSDSIRCGRF